MSELARNPVDGLEAEALRTLRNARGPLTAAEVRGRIQQRHRGIVLHADVYNRLARLCALGLAASRVDTHGSATSRIYWPTGTN